MLTLELEKRDKFLYVLHQTIKFVHCLFIVCLLFNPLSLWAPKNAHKQWEFIGSEFPIVASKSAVNSTNGIGIGLGNFNNCKIWILYFYWIC
jgi:hypothetical protein